VRPRFSNIMDFGTGIAKAGDYFSQAIMGRHEEQERLKREALAQKNFEAEMNWRNSQNDRQQAKDLFDQNLRALQTMPQGAELTPETANALPATLREGYTRRIPQTPDGFLNMDGSPLERKPERFEVQSPYRYQTEVATIGADARRDVAGAQIASREGLARQARENMSSYQQAMVELGKTRNSLTAQRLNNAIKMHGEMIANQNIMNVQDAQSAWDIAFSRAFADDAGFKMPVPRPTGGTKPGAKPLSLDQAAAGIASKVGF
jgi:hypothetical protein